MQPEQSQTNAAGQSIPAEVIEFAHQQFERARNGDELLISYIEAGMSPNLTNDAGNTLLMLAAYAGHASLTKKLLEKGADPNRINDRGQSIIAGATFKGYFEVAKALLEGGADVHLGQPNAIDTARMFKHEELLKLYGVDSSTAASSEPER